jgi:hypothetical protein
VSGLTSLEARFADGHVPLGIVLGTIGAVSLIKNLLPDEARKAFPDETDHADMRASGSDESRPIEPFLALLVGAVATHDRLIALVDRAGASVSDGRHDREAVATDSLEGIAR